MDYTQKAGNYGPGTNKLAFTRVTCKLKSLMSRQSDRMQTIAVLRNSISMAKLRPGIISEISLNDTN